MAHRLGHVEVAYAPSPSMAEHHELRSDVDELQQQVDRLAVPPIGAWEYVEVVFTAGGVDVDIPHTLDPTDPESVRFLVVSTSANVVVYQDITGTRKAWQSSYIWLRASAASTVRLLLFTEPSDA